MATVNFRVKGKVSPVNILIRLKHGDKFDYERATGLQIELDHWNKDKQKVRNVVSATYKDYVNNRLNKLKAYIESNYYNTLADGEEVSQKWLETNVNDFFERPDPSANDSKFYLTSFAENFINEVKGKIDLRTGKPLSERTIGYYELTVSKIKEYEKFNDKRVRLIDVNLEFHEFF